MIVYICAHVCEYVHHPVFALENVHVFTWVFAYFCEKKPQKNKAEMITSDRAGGNEEVGWGASSESNSTQFRTLNHVNILHHQKQN